MEHLFNLIEMRTADSRIKVPTTESTMMQIVHSAMNKAYRKVKSRNGVLERLNEISKFYELAVMQLEGCLKFVQEETDNCVLESSHEVLLEELTEIKDRLQGRLNEVEQAISEKDKELAERLAKELKRRKALEKELDSLHADLKLEKMKNEGTGELFLGSQASNNNDNGDKEGEFCELKNSVDLQVLNIRQQLELNCQLSDEERSPVSDNKKIEQMGSDISILKETMDLAFCKMQKAIFLSELEPIERQWMWNIERGTATIVIKGFMKDYQQIFEGEVKKREMRVSDGLRKHLSDVVREMTCLSHELELHTDEDEVQIMNSSKHNKVSPLKAKRRTLSEGNFGNSNNFSLDVEEGNAIKQPCEKDSGDDSGNFVAKMIKNHESIIRKKSAEVSFRKPESLREKGCPSLRRQTDSVYLKRRIQDVIASLESKINWNSGSGHSFGDCRFNYEVEYPSNESSLTADPMDMNESGIESMEEIWAKVNKSSVSHVENEETCSKMRILRQEMEDANLQTVMMEETYLTLFRSSVDEFRTEILNRHLQFLIKEGMYESFIEEMKSELNDKSGSNRIEVQTREENCDTVISDSSHKAEPFSGFGALEGMLAEDVYTFLLEEILGEWNENTKSYKSKMSLGQELCFIVFGETVRDIMNTANCELSKLQDTKVHDILDSDFQFSNKIFGSAAVSVKDDVWKVYLAEMIKEWEMKIDCSNLESSIGEDVLQFVIAETMKEAEEMSSNNLLASQTSVKEDEKENVTQTLHSLLEFLEEEEALMLSACSEIKEQKMRLDLVRSVSDVLDGKGHFKLLLTNEQSSTILTYSQLEKALRQLDIGKAMLSELGWQLGVTVGNSERFHNEMAPPIATKSFSESLIFQSKDVEEAKLKMYESLLSHIQELSQILKGFERSTCTRLGRHISRLEEMKNQLDLVFELSASLRQKESLYRKAFIRRCEILQLAETEVDLLGDQVDLLQGLLEKIYVTLHRYSPVLEQHFEVSEMLKLIEKEVGGRR